VVSNQRRGFPADYRLEERYSRRLHLHGHQLDYGLKMESRARTYVSEGTLTASYLVVLPVDARDGDVLESVVCKPHEERVLRVSIRDACNEGSARFVAAQ
jgi:hypothetical protein